MTWNINIVENNQYVEQADHIFAESFRKFRAFSIVVALKRPLSSMSMNGLTSSFVILNLGRPCIMILGITSNSLPVISQLIGYMQSVVTELPRYHLSGFLSLLNFIDKCDLMVMRK